MFATLKTLFAGADARAEETLRDRFAIDLIDQKIREATASLKSAKFALADLIQRDRAETRQLQSLATRIQDLTDRAGQAMTAGRADLAQEAAQAIADLENESAVRQASQQKLEGRILQLRQSIDRANRRLTDLKQGAVAARATRREMQMQKRLTKTAPGGTAFDEAEELIASVLNRDDPFEKSQILSEIDRGLDPASTAERLAEAGFGPNSRTTAADVLTRLKAATAAPPSINLPSKRT